MKKILLFLFLIACSLPVFADTINHDFDFRADVTLESCDEDGDGSAEFDLAASIPDILDGMNAADFEVSFHFSNADAANGNNDIDMSFMYSSPSITLFSRTEQIADPSVFTVGRVRLVANQKPRTKFPSDVILEICPDSKEGLEIITTGNNYGPNSATYQWYKDNQPIAGETTRILTIFEAGFYELDITINDTGCNSRDGFEVEEVQNCVIPQGISPNGDGFNDSFDLTDFRVTNIEIFNRYGMKVYSSSNYTNGWRGQSDDGKDLPVGTYFYTLNYKEGQKASGWVYIQRQK